MTDVRETYHPRMAQPLDLEQLVDDVRQEFNNIESLWVPPSVFEVIDSNFNALLAALLEKGYTYGLTDPNNVLNNSNIVNWDNAYAQSTESLMTVDAASGEYALKVDGKYRVESNFIGTLTGNNVTHTIAVEVDRGGVGTWVPAVSLGVVLATQQTNEVSLTGFAFSDLLAGDKIRFAHISSSGTNAFTASTAQTQVEYMGK